MVAAGYLVELLFGAARLIPTHRNAMVMNAGISWNYTTWLNIAFVILAAALVVRFITTGGIPMLRMMGGSPDAEHTGHCHTTTESHRDNNQGHGHKECGGEDERRALGEPTRYSHHDGSEH